VLDAENVVAIITCGIKRTAKRQERATEERAAQCRLLRDIFGNPFQPVTIDSLWLGRNDQMVVKVANANYNDRAFDRLPILADALEEAGCNNADILTHLREPGAHVRGCWVVDLLTGRT
jgi:hypothetical protein